ncbi:MOSC domain-containing protein YiiM [Hymenobacter daecheongensis DSM 21074]|uniref:MOSC domain-containing protein YiiM n=1 Tax=Hymenobacter daecheongensis DSM 21074 TaxID=1121955 RepID=A0A1M6GYM4_9BACT|nr:MOSC domain-containing protein [Hymenobacter daecheongensis]SHJ15010.1 MOSC domain-containing protein YiiM [Hymenobacter daecheongensis DSM 21074]
MTSVPALTLPLAALLVGRPESLGTPDAPTQLARTWVSAIRKTAVQDAIWLDALNLEGDAQAHPKVHGGPDQALCVYPGGHYPHWAERLGHALPPGSFGENLTLAGPATEHDVCIGDVFRLGEAVVQITQPRSPCYQLGLRWQQPLLPKWLQDSGRTGWYMRVLQPGHVAPTDSLQLTQRPYPEWPVARANSVKYELRDDLTLSAALAACPALGQQWRSKMLGRVSGALPLYDDANRLQGLNAE